MALIICRLLFSAVAAQPWEQHVGWEAALWLCEQPAAALLLEQPWAGSASLWQPPCSLPGLPSLPASCSGSFFSLPVVLHLPPAAWLCLCSRRSCWKVSVFLEAVGCHLSMLVCSGALQCWSPGAAAGGFTPKEIKVLLPISSYLSSFGVRRWK